MRSYWKVFIGIVAIIVSMSAQPASAQAPPNDQLSFYVLFGADDLRSNVNAVRRKAASLPSAVRYEYLKNWVLPSETHSEIRVIGEFVPTDPSPLARQLEPYRFRSERGGELVSPVFDLLETAKATGRLGELQSQIELALKRAKTHRTSSGLALLFLVSLERGDETTAAAAINELQAAIKKQTAKSVDDMWPETLAISRGMSRSESVDLVSSLLTSLYLQRTQQNIPRGIGYWHRHVAGLMESYRQFSANQTSDSDQAGAELRNWIPTSRYDSKSRGNGSPHAWWYRDGNNEVRHLSGIDEDYLLFRSPLQGEFEFRGEIGSRGTTQLLAAGRYLGTRGSVEMLEKGNFWRGSSMEKMETPFSWLGEWVPFRVLFGAGECTIYLNGIPVQTDPLTPNHDPWVGVRTWGTLAGKLRYVQISGDPQIPDQLDLTASEDLRGWGAYYQESAGRIGAVWQRVENSQGQIEIHAERHPSPAGSFDESLLSYCRPITEDGSIDYDFYYQSHRIEVHPALDRLAFMLSEDGARTHWMTDGRFDRTGIAPDNLIAEPHNRRASGRLPLKNNDWNHLKLSIAGDIVSLELNDELIFERELETTNRRIFGLFRYADQTEVRVRNVVMRGDWPRELSPPDEQELADDVAASLDAGRANLASEFHHDFAKAGLPDRFFIQEQPDNRGGSQRNSQGILVTRQSVGNYSAHGLKLRFAALGDFDIEASFEQFRAESDKQASVMLFLRLDDEEQHRCRLSRMMNLRGWQQLNAAVSFLHNNGRLTYDTQFAGCQVDSGTLRIARRGDVVHYLFAEPGSSVYQRLRSEKVSNLPTIQNGISLVTGCNGTGTTSVIWKSVTLRADRLMYLSPETATEPRKLYAMTPEGSLRVVLGAPADGYVHMGSPECSVTGDRITLDMSKGSVDSSHVIVVKRDGSELVDLGSGCMPSLSRDGKSIVFSQRGTGIMMMDSDGTNRKIVDRAGWGVQYSPDGKQIAYGTYTNFTLLEIETNKKKTLLTGDLAERYSSVYWNLGWSHDSRAIAFKGRNRSTGKNELAVVNIGDPTHLEILDSGPGIEADFTFTPDNQSVLFAKSEPGKSGPRLYLAHRQPPGEVELLKVQPADQVIYDCDWSTDGAEIVFSSKQSSVPVEWPLEDKSSP